MRRTGRPAACIALLATLLLAAIWVASPGGLREVLRERAADLLHRGPADAGAVAVVDIDRAALLRVGPWPWSRASLAALLRAVAEARPAAIALDILLAEPDRLSPAALARRLAEATGRAEIADLAAALEDGDAALAAAIGATPVALGFVLETRATEDAPPSVPLLVQGVVRLPGIWQAPGLQGPLPALAEAAAGLGLLALDADADGRVRRVPLLALVGDAARPGLALEALRLRERAGALLLLADPPRLVVGGHGVPLDATATLRLPPSPPETWPARTVSAAALLTDPAAQASRLAGRIVLLGGSAPELGGLRPAAGGTPVPSVQLQADAVAALLHGGAPIRPDWLASAEVAGAVLLAFVAAAAALRLRPRNAALLACAVVLVWVAAAWLALRAGLLLDPAGPPAVAGLAYAVAALLAFAEAERRARAMRTRFEQRLAPDIVRRIAAAPEAVRLGGETREITALFTDIEGFTAMTERAAPTELVALLDAYLDAMTRIVVSHGGMVEKIVGDAVHAVFNAPLDLSDHPRRALDCARALLAAAEAQRATPLGQRLGLGRTRIGIETGPAVVGDVGGSGRLDYTAHGDVMNTAARLEAANKQLGTSICVGPVAAARIGVDRLVPLGAHAVRGRGVALDLYTVTVT
ncbi:CHASE2 domain-containing protein [Falsiroseomonas sp.]|uniref:CHASE2 domain-containing protein n=1 Tax=Falsiroseomonas sp. TaxID=2870721 RepID=UPI0035636A10